jgi:hypothetical protein
MKFWELYSIFRDDRETLRRLLAEEAVDPYLKWFDSLTDIVNAQDRQVLDAVIPERLAARAMQACKLRFFVRDGTLHFCPPGSVHEGQLSAFDVYHNYGGSVIEEVLEKGCWQLPGRQT